MEITNFANGYGDSGPVTCRCPKSLGKSLWFHRFEWWDKASITFHFPQKLWKWKCFQWFLGLGAGPCCFSPPQKNMVALHVFNDIVGGARAPVMSHLSNNYKIIMFPMIWEWGGGACHTPPLWKPMELKMFATIWAVGRGRRSAPPPPLQKNYGMLSMILELGRRPHPSPLTAPKNCGNQNVFNDSEVGGTNGNQKDIMGFHVLSKGRSWRQNN